MKAQILIKTFFILLFASLAMLACSSMKEVSYEFPAEMLPHVKVGYTEQCEKGKKLYMMNCAGCHNYKKGRRELVPDFRPEQLRGYELRIANAKHEQNMPDSLVSEEELGIIMTFLRYKKKNPR